MKKKMGIITLLLLVIFLPTIVYAQSFTTTLNGVGFEPKVQIQTSYVVT